MAGELWFRTKTYGWGWTPANWKGRAVTIAYFLVCALWLVDVVTEENLAAADTSKLVLKLAVMVLIPTAILFAICWLKGERPRWRWGKLT